jgi:uncharacterized protein YPO0396
MHHITSYLAAQHLYLQGCLLVVMIGRAGMPLLQVRDKQESLRACTEDLANLTDHYNSVRAAKELAQKELAKIKRQTEEAKHDWQRKLRERRAEVGLSNSTRALPLFQTDPNFGRACHDVLP